MKTSEITINEEILKGQYIADFLGLKQSRSGKHYSTNSGTKTAFGLYQCILRIVETPFDELPTEGGIGKAISIYTVALNKLSMKATHSDDGFRQMIYPNLPESYEISEDIKNKVKELVAKGKNANQIVEEIK